MNEIIEQESSTNEPLDHYRLCCLIQELKTDNVFTMWPIQQSKWVEENEVGKQITAILQNHPEYFEEFRWALAGIFPSPTAS